MLIGELEVALDVGQKLDSLGVTWLVGGSVASSSLGEPPATADVDLVADPRGRVQASFWSETGTVTMSAPCSRRWSTPTTSTRTRRRQRSGSAVRSTSSS